MWYSILSAGLAALGPYLPSFLCPRERGRFSLDDLRLAVPPADEHVAADGIGNLHNVRGQQIHGGDIVTLDALFHQPHADFELCDGLALEKVHSHDYLPSCPGQLR